MKCLFRSLGSLPEILYHLTYVTQTRYTGALLNEVEFHNKTSLQLGAGQGLSWMDESTGQEHTCEGNAWKFGCRYIHFISFMFQQYWILLISI